MLKSAWQWLDGKKQKLANIYWGIIVPALAVPMASGVTVPKWVVVTAGIVGVLFSYIGITHAAYKSQIAQSQMPGNAGDAKQGAIVGAGLAGLAAITAVALLGGKFSSADISGDITLLDSTIVIAHVKEAIPQAAALAQAQAEAVLAGDTVDMSRIPKDTVPAHPVLNQERICDVPAGKVLYVQAGWMDAETKAKTETYSVLYPADLTTGGNVMRVNAQLTFSNQPAAKE
jgi:hypothetical protein